MPYGQTLILASRGPVTFAVFALLMPVLPLIGQGTNLVTVDRLP